MVPTTSSSQKNLSSSASKHRNAGIMLPPKAPLIPLRLPKNAVARELLMDVSDEELDGARKDSDYEDDGDDGGGDENENHLDENDDRSLHNDSLVDEESDEDVSMMSIHLLLVI